MADIKVIYIDSNGFSVEHSESSDSIKLLSMKTANHELTDTKLSHLIGGADAADEHIHDARYFREDEHIATSAGAGDAGKPIKLDAGGKIDESLLDLAGIASGLDHGSLTGLGDDDHTIYTKADGTRAFSGNQSMGGNKLTNLANPDAGTDAVNLQTLQTYIQGMKPKEAVRVATVAAGTLATSFVNGNSIDGVVLATGNRILIKNQASASENGIYIVQASGAPVRATDFDSLTPVDEINGALVGVQEGTENAGKTYVQQGTVATIGTDAINFVFFNAIDSISASNGVVRVGNDFQIASSAAGDGLGFASGVLSVNVDGSSLEINADSLRVKAAGIKDTMIDFGTGAGQVSGADIPLADAGAWFTTDNVESALQDVAVASYRAGTALTAGASGVAKGDLVYISGANVGDKFGTLTNPEHCVGLAHVAAASGAAFRALRNGQPLTGVLTGATPGQEYYWNGTGYQTTIPTTAGAYVWQVGVAKNATDLIVQVQRVKKNA